MERLNFRYSDSRPPQGCFWIRTQPCDLYDLDVEVIAKANYLIEELDYSGFRYLEYRSLRQLVELRFPSTDFVVEIHTPWLLDHRVYEVLTIKYYIYDGDPGWPDVHCALTWRMLPS